MSNDFFPWWTEEQKKFQQEVRTFMRKWAPREMEQRWERDVAFDFYEAFGKTGFTGAAIPKEYGGLGLGVTGGCIVAEEVHSVSPGYGRIVVGNMMGGVMQVIEHGTDAQKKTFLPRMAAGEIGCVAITDMTAGFFWPGEGWNYRGEESILISGVVFINNPDEVNTGLIADVFILYYPRIGKVSTVHINHRYMIRVSPEQYQMKPGHWFEYLDGQLFPRGVISKNGTGDVYLLSGEANLGMFKSQNEEALIANGYGYWYWEIRRITNAYDGHPMGREPRIWSLFYGPIEVFESVDRIPELSVYRHAVDPALIVFRANDNYTKFVVASIGSDDSQVCTALEFDIVAKTPEEYYWIDRNEFLDMAGMGGSHKLPGIPWGSQWSERNMDSFIDR
jgi:hypothetical protein